MRPYFAEWTLNSPGRLSFSLFLCCAWTLAFVRLFSLASFPRCNRSFWSPSHNQPSIGTQLKIEPVRCGFPVPPFPFFLFFALLSFVAATLFSLTFPAVTHNSPVASAVLYVRQSPVKHRNGVLSRVFSHLLVSPISSSLSSSL